MTAATNRRNRRANTRSRRRAGASWSPRAARQRWADTYSDPMFLTAVDGPSGRLATYVYDSESKRRRIYEGAAFTTLVWDWWDYLQWRRPSGTHVFHTINGEIVGESVGGVVRDYLLDPLGSMVATLDAGGLVDQFEYWPYGELVDDLPEGAPVFLWVGGLGYWFDTDERRYVRHRMLRTDLGSWMQLDPLWPWEPPVVLGSPATRTDRLGLSQDPNTVAGSVTCYSGKEGFKNCCTACGECFTWSMQCSAIGATLRTGSGWNVWRCGDLIGCEYKGERNLTPRSFLVLIVDTGGGTLDAVIDLGCCYAMGKLGWLTSPNARLPVECRIFRKRARPPSRQCLRPDDCAPPRDRGKHCQR